MGGAEAGFEVSSMFDFVYTCNTGPGLAMKHHTLSVATEYVFGAILKRQMALSNYPNVILGFWSQHFPETRTAQVDLQLNH